MVGLNFIFKIKYFYNFPFFFKIKETWQYVYMKNFLEKKLNVCSDCRNFYFYYQKGFTEQGVLNLFTFTHK